MQQANLPLLLLWGVKDPWCTPAKAEQVRQLYVPHLTNFVPIHDAAHCPHDDNPAETNAALRSWLKSL
jgi:pimeloyl-ACP methyl ester carboxylesterase